MKWLRGPASARGT